MSRLEDDERYSVRPGEPGSDTLVVQVAEAIANDDLRQLEKRRRANAHACIKRAAQIIAPAIGLAVQVPYEYEYEYEIEMILFTSILQANSVLRSFHSHIRTRSSCSYIVAVCCTALEHSSSHNVVHMCVCFATGAGAAARGHVGAESAGEYVLGGLRLVPRAGAHVHLLGPRARHGDRQGARLSQAEGHPHGALHLYTVHYTCICFPLSLRLITRTFNATTVNQYILLKQQ